MAIFSYVAPLHSNLPLNVQDIERGYTHKYIDIFYIFFIFFILKIWQIDGHSMTFSDVEGFETLVWLIYGTYE